METFHLCPYRTRTEGITSRSSHAIQDHSRQVDALGRDSGETRGRAADIRVPRQTNCRNDRGGDDHCRLHSSLLLHLFRPSLSLPGNRSLHFTHQCTTDRTGFGPSLYESFPRKISEGRQFLFSPQSGHCAAIQESGIVPTGAGMFSPHILQRMVKSQQRVSGRLNTGRSIGEQKAKLQCGILSARTGRKCATRGTYLSLLFSIAYGAEG
jgi:hypothetical protein